MTSSGSREQQPSVDVAPTDYAGLTGAVRELVKVMREGGISQLEIEQGDLKIALRAHDSGAPRSSGPLPVAEDEQAAQPSAPASPEQDGVRVVTSPMIGTFYAAPAPGERPFVLAGDRVEAGQTVAIIEAMKIMNEIVSEWSGTVEEVLVTDGEAVEYGHPLMRVRVDP